MGEQKKLPWIIVGVLVLALIGGGIYAYTDLHHSSAAAQDSAPQSQVAGRSNAQFRNNPALRVVMGLQRLQRDPQLSLTSDQKAKIKPILQDLINETNPSQEFLQSKADAINAVLTDQQKAALTSPRNGQGRPNGRNFNGGNGANGASPRGNWPNGNGAAGNGTNRASFSPQDLYKRVLDSLQ